MKTLIHYWEGVLRQHAWFMPAETQTMIRETLRVLRQAAKAEKAARMPAVLRQAEETREAKVQRR